MIGLIRNAGREAREWLPHNFLMAGLSAVITMTIFTLVIAPHT